MLVLYMLAGAHSHAEEMLARDEVAEWLRRWTANPMGSARVGSNPILVVRLFVKLQMRTRTG